MKSMARTLAAAVLTAGAVILPLAGTAAAVPGPGPIAPHAAVSAGYDRGGDRFGDRDRDGYRGRFGDRDRDGYWGRGEDRTGDRGGYLDRRYRCYWSHNHGWGHHHGRGHWVCVPSWLR